MATKSEPAPTGTQLAVLEALLPQIQALDEFAEANSLAVLTEGKGAFVAAINVASAIGRLKEMLTPEIMKPIMLLQGTALGFKTDRDNPKDGGEKGYSIEVVRECFIEATLKGFKMVGNQSNIIANRFYATKEGFEDFFLRQAKLGKFTDYREVYSIPKITSESEAIVICSATWKWDKKDDQFKDVSISIRINKGQGADAILGKAKRKLLARIYSRVTGTVITEGDANEPQIIDVEAKKVAEGGAAGPGSTTPVPATPEQIQLIKELLTENNCIDQANAWLRAQKAIPATATYLDASAKLASRILADSKSFIKTVTETKPA